MLRRIPTFWDVWKVHWAYVNGWNHKAINTSSLMTKMVQIVVSMHYADIEVFSVEDIGFKLDIGCTSMIWFNIILVFLALSNLWNKQNRTAEIRYK